MGYLTFNVDGTNNMNVLHNLDKKYYLDGTLVATNKRKAMCQTSDSLEEYKEKLLQQMSVTEAEKIISKLICKPHKPAVKDIHRVLPGAVVKCGNDTFILKGSNGKHDGVPDYYVSESNEKYRYKACRVIRHNQGLVIMQ